MSCYYRVVIISSLSNIISCISRGGDIAIIIINIIFNTVVIPTIIINIIVIIMITIKVMMLTMMIIIAIQSVCRYLCVCNISFIHICLSVSFFLFHFEREQTSPIELYWLPEVSRMSRLARTSQTAKQGRRPPPPQQSLQPHTRTQD